MFVDNINKIVPHPRVLISPLDWGLGHATRCIPIINVLNEHNIDVYLAAEGPVAELLKEEYPAIVILPLKGYKIKYNRRRSFFFLSMILQFPKVFAAINHEKKWLKETIKQYNIDAVISDNRFGLSNKKIPCVYVTHQLHIQTGNKLLNKIAQKINYYFINKFNECWVPDMEGKTNLAGELSHPIKLPNIQLKYIGVLSRCHKITIEKKYHLLIVLSGPEPQRTIFENILLQQLNNLETVVLIRGLPGNKIKLEIKNKDLIVHDHLPAKVLNEVIQASENIISRCGYSTIMDLITLQQKAILVPTPGQTEQEYLAAYLKEKKLFFSCPQENFSIRQALAASKNFNNNSFSDKVGIQKKIIEDWIYDLKKTSSPLQ